MGVPSSYTEITKGKLTLQKALVWKNDGSLKLDIELLRNKLPRILILFLPVSSHIFLLHHYRNPFPALVKLNNDYATKQNKGVSPEKVMMSLAWNVMDLGNLNESGRRVVRKFCNIKQRPA